MSELASPHDRELLLWQLRRRQHEAWQEGEPLAAEALLNEHPAHAADVEFALELVYAEYVLREALGQSIAREEFFARFPHLAGRLAAQFEFDDALYTSNLSARALNQTSTDSKLWSAHRDGEGRALAEVDPLMLVAPRYRIEARIGQGGMGTVYRAIDTTRREPVAIKFLHRRGISAAERIRREFRALVELAHPNLVQLFELRIDGEHGFVAMEWIDGVDWLTYVRAIGPACPLRLRATLLQVADALACVHAAGRLHRDLKPANTLVDVQGRVVLIDFGLSTELDTTESAVRPIAGTLPYMAPEQFDARPLSPAADWYSLGVMLYEALTGVLPFTGDLRAQLEAKRKPLTGDELERLTAAPADLAALCIELLASDPAARAGYEAVCRAAQFGASPVRASPRSSTSQVRQLIGRARELEQLETAWLKAQTGEAAVVIVDGVSGIGKTSLVRDFAQRQAEQGALVLRSRCYEREAFPFKAVEALVAGAVDYVADQPAPQRAELAPAALAGAVPLFPKLARLVGKPKAPADGRNDSHGKPTGSIDGAAAPTLAHASLPTPPAVLAGEALRRWLMVLARATPIIAVIDDVQWDDADSAELVAAVLRPPAPPPILWLWCVRRESRRQSHLIELFERHDFRSLIYQATISLEGLSTSDGVRLLAELVAARPAAARPADTNLDRLRDWVADTGGHPYLIERCAATIGRGEHEPSLPALVPPGDFVPAADDRREEQPPRHDARASDHRQKDAAPPRNGANHAQAIETPRSLAAALEWQIAELSPIDRAALILLAVAARPLPREVLLFSLGPGADPLVIPRLAAARLARTQAAQGRELIETYHDRVRDAATSPLSSADWRHLHRTLAEGWRQSGLAQPSDLVVHLAGGGDTAAAAEVALEAVRDAERQFAFDHAADLLSQALGWKAWSVAERRAIQTRQAEALWNAGRQREAATIYKQLADDAESSGAADPRAVDAFRRRAGRAWIRCGEVEHGFAVLRDTLDRMGLSCSYSPGRVAAQLGWRCFTALAAGSPFCRPVDVPVIDDESRENLDLVARMMVDIDLVDPMLGIGLFLQTAGRIIASRCPSLYLRGLTIDMATWSQIWRPNSPMVLRLAQVGRGLFRRSRLWDQNMFHSGFGLVRLSAGHWRRCLRHLVWNETHMNGLGPDVTSELFVTRGFAQLPRFYLGRLHDMASYLPSALQDARRRQDAYAELVLCSGHHATVWLMEDRPELARESLQAAKRKWKQREFLLHDLFALVAENHIALYEGRFAAAWARMKQSWPEFERSHLTTLAPMANEGYHVRGRAALAAGIAGLGGNRWRSELAAVIRQFRRQKYRATAAFAAWYEAALADLDRRVHAATLLLDAAARCRQADMPLFAAAAEYRAGQRLGTSGQIWIDRAIATLRASSIVNPHAFAAMLLPSIAAGEVRRASAGDQDGDGNGRP